jgi:trans-o-hydroxybenzylidenepyruvate hydratase-aldolase
MLTSKDISGVYVMAPTPCVEGGDHWSNTSSVDLEESARMTENFVRDGVGGIAACGTTGECAALLWEEKREFIDTLVQVARKRVPIFAGATSLGTKETIRQMRAFRDMGADGAFVGLPLWQTPTLENSVRWFEELSEAVPDLPIMVYSNAMFFKSTFPLPFWQGVAKRAPTVITNKITSPAIMEKLEEIVETTGDRISYLPQEMNAYNAWQRVGNKIRGIWSTSASMGPEPSVAFSRAINANDRERIEEIHNDLRSIPAFRPQGQEDAERYLQFPQLNVQAEKARFRAAGYIKCGPARTPYKDVDLPDDWQRSAEANGKGWAELRKKYAGTAAASA